MTRYAYNNFAIEQEYLKPAPLKEWNALAKRVELQFLHSHKLKKKTSSIDSEIDNLTADWSLTDREKFRHWFKHTKTVHAELGTFMERIASSPYSPHGSSDFQVQFDSSRKSLTRRLRKLQNEISELYQSSHKQMQWGDTPGAKSNFSSGEEKIAAILQALNQVCTLLSTLRTKEVTAAVLMRTAGIIEKIDPGIASQYKTIVGGREGLVKVARSAEIASVAADLKKEMDIFHYGTHLRRMYGIYDKLSKLGMNSAMDEIESLIQKDLSDITGLYKKLSEVYVTLMELPDESNNERGQEKPAANAPLPATPSPTPPSMKRDFETIDEKPQNMPALKSFNG